MRDQSYSKKEKLKSKNEISLLFDKGKWRTSGNLRIINLKKEQFPDFEFVEGDHKIGVAVSKKLFKKAVDRNRIKRLLREAYRLHKEIFKKEFGKDSLSMLFWVSNRKPTKFSEVEEQLLILCKSKK